MFLYISKYFFNQDFLISAGNLMTYENVLGSGMKCDTSEPDYNKVVNAFFSSVTTAINNLFKPFPMIFNENSAPFRSFCVCLIQSHILNLEYPALGSGCI